MKPIVKFFGILTVVVLCQVAIGQESRYDWYYEPTLNSGSSFDNGLTGGTDFYNNGLAGFYWILEGTKGEFVAVGSDGSIRRWSYTGENTQVWCIYPEKSDENGETMYRIQPCKTRNFWGSVVMAMLGDGEKRTIIPNFSSSKP